jgi:hypothetical protein
MHRTSLPLSIFVAAALAAAACAPRDDAPAGADDAPAATQSDDVTSGQPVKDMPPAMRRGIVYYETNRGTCTGVLVKRDRVLTAKHCVNGGVTAGSLAVRPGFNAFGNDPLVVKAKGPLRLNPAVDLATFDLREDVPDRFDPVTLVEASDQPVAGEAVALGGYGAVGQGACDESLEQPDKAQWGLMSFAGTQTFEAETYLRAEASPGGTVLCRGDSGGPAMVLRENRWRLSGINARSDFATFSLFSDVRPHRAWILGDG